MIDPKPAIIDLHRDGHSVRRISNVLGVSHHTVTNTLIAAGVIQKDTPELTGGRGYAARRRAEEAEGAAPSHDDLQAQIDNLTAQVEGEKAKAKRETDKLKAVPCPAAYSSSCSIRPRVSARARNSAEQVLWPIAWPIDAEAAPEGAAIPLVS